MAALIGLAACAEVVVESQLEALRAARRPEADAARYAWSDAARRAAERWRLTLSALLALAAWALGESPHPDVTAAGGVLCIVGSASLHASYAARLRSAATSLWRLNGGGRGRAALVCVHAMRNMTRWLRPGHALLQQGGARGAAAAAAAAANRGRRERELLELDIMARLLPMTAVSAGALISQCLSF